MPRAEHHIIDPTRFVFAGQKIEALVFIVNTVSGEEVLRIGLDHYAMINGQGEILARITPREAHQIARELVNTVELLKVKQKVKETTHG